MSDKKDISGDELDARVELLRQKGFFDEQWVRLWEEPNLQYSQSARKHFEDKYPPISRFAALLCYCSANATMAPCLSQLPGWKEAHADFTAKFVGDVRSRKLKPHTLFNGGLIQCCQDLMIEFGAKCAKLKVPEELEETVFKQTARAAGQIAAIMQRLNAISQAIHECKLPPKAPAKEEEKGKGAGVDDAISPQDLDILADKLQQSGYIRQQWNAMFAEPIFTSASNVCAHLEAHKDLTDIGRFRLALTACAVLVVVPARATSLYGIGKKTVKQLNDAVLREDLRPYKLFDGQYVNACIDIRDEGLRNVPKLPQKEMEEDREANRLRFASVLFRLAEIRNRILLEHAAGKIPEQKNASQGAFTEEEMNKRLLRLVENGYLAARWKELSDNPLFRGVSSYLGPGLNLPGIVTRFHRAVFYTAMEYIIPPSTDNPEEETKRAFSAIEPLTRAFRPDEKQPVQVFSGMSSRVVAAVRDAFLNEHPIKVSSMEQISAVVDELAMNNDRMLFLQDKLAAIYAAAQKSCFHCQTPAPEARCSHCSQILCLGVCELKHKCRSDLRLWSNAVFFFDSAKTKSAALPAMDIPEFDISGWTEIYTSATMEKRIRRMQQIEKFHLPRHWKAFRRQARLHLHPRLDQQCEDTPHFSRRFYRALVVISGDLLFPSALRDAWPEGLKWWSSTGASLMMDGERKRQEDECSPFDLVTFKALHARAKEMVAHGMLPEVPQQFQKLFVFQRGLARRRMEILLRHMRTIARLIMRPCTICGSPCAHLFCAEKRADGEQCWRPLCGRKECSKAHAKQKTCVLVPASK